MSKLLYEYGINVSNQIIKDLNLTKKEILDFINTNKNNKSDYFRGLVKGFNNYLNCNKDTFE